MTDTDTARDARIVVGIDGSTDGDEALDLAASEAVMRHAELDVVLVWSPPLQAGPFGEMSIPVDVTAQESVARRILDDRVDTVLARLEERPSRVERILVSDPSPSRVLMETAKNADLLVVGCRGRGGFARLLLGSVSQQCVQHAPCPVLVARHDDS